MTNCETLLFPSLRENVFNNSFVCIYKRKKSVFFLSLQYVASKLSTHRMEYLQSPGVHLYKSKALRYIWGRVSDWLDRFTCGLDPAPIDYVLPRLYFSAYVNGHSSFCVMPFCELDWSIEH